MKSRGRYLERVAVMRRRSWAGGRPGVCGHWRWGAAKRRVGGRASVCAGGWARSPYLSGPAAPCTVAQHCRAKIGGAAEPCHVNDRDSGRRHVSPLPRHHV